MVVSSFLGKVIIVLVGKEFPSIDPPLVASIRSYWKISYEEEPEC
jgi:hypothetical protein